MSRPFDIAAGVLLLVIGFVVLLPFSVWILLTEREAPLFKQLRIGLNNRPFTIYKIRTMQDGKITKTGKFLRKSRLDELPQAINLLNGSMTFIGPRPETIGLVEEYARSISQYNQRHQTKPGITGLAAVTQGHTEPGLEATERKLGYDLYYLKHKSFWLDAFIVFKTVQTILGLKGK